MLPISPRDTVIKRSFLSQPNYFFVFFVVFFLGFHPFFFSHGLLGISILTSLLTPKTFKYEDSLFSWHCCRPSNELDHNQGYGFPPPANNRSCFHALRMFHARLRRSRYPASHAFTHPHALGAGLPASGLYNYIVKWVMIAPQFISNIFYL